ncbi:MAG: hypothetical protein K2Y29_18540 [Beijerinckiaceae bacterium]|nr:hypothetical protein [Beijerinckiaceae bacterium]
MDDDSNHSEKRKLRSFTHASRFVLSVDGQRKSSYEVQADAMTAGAKIAQAYPRVSVSVHDQQEQTRTDIPSDKASEA